MGRVLSLLAVPLLTLPLLAACGAATTPTDTLAPPTALPTSPITPEPTFPPDTSSPADTPSREEAYEQLIASIPPEIAASCKPAPKSEAFPPGQQAQADCDLPSGSLANHVSYRIFDGIDSMDAFFDSQRQAHEAAGDANGPGCGKGPGEGTWDSGQKDCFAANGNEAHVMWTHDLVYILADAFRTDGNFAKLEAFWGTAGPLTP